MQFNKLLISLVLVLGLLQPGFFPGLEQTQKNQCTQKYPLVPINEKQQSKLS
jgi:hypothetical protein